jgi:hypothetical protein
LDRISELSEIRLGESWTHHLCLELAI